MELEFDISYMPLPHTGHLIPQKTVIKAFKHIYDHKPFNSILEFGFNTGWSSAILLTLFPDITVTSVEIIKNENSQKGAQILKEKFENRHSIIWMDSNLLYEEVVNDLFHMPKNYDTAFIDGGHQYETVYRDISLSLYLGIKNFIFDDGDDPDIQKAIKSFDLKRLQCYLYEAYMKKATEYKKRSKSRKAPLGLQHYCYES